tara:strand:+ start:695 stop:1471 length:777 start_codon:yes stop_codon:yes gene_type:complete
MIAVSYGGGLNSTALLVGMEERGLAPDVVIFADTGGERQATYDVVDRVEAWCDGLGWRFARVTNADPEGERHGHKSLEDECHRNETLPSLAFGFKGCSAKWKRQPMDRFLRSDAQAQAVWERGELVERWLGIDADESHRSANLTDDKHWTYRRPLIDWQWGRDECAEAVERSGLGPIGKSACWFCPAMKKAEVLRLAEDEPDLFRRAVEMEHSASPNLGTVRGLGRRFSWEALRNADLAQMRLFPDPTVSACGCYDGE